MGWEGEVGSENVGGTVDNRTLKAKQGIFKLDVVGDGESLRTLTLGNSPFSLGHDWVVGSDGPLLTSPRAHLLCLWLNRETQGGRWSASPKAA